MVSQSHFSKATLVVPITFGIAGEKNSYLSLIYFFTVHYCDVIVIIIIIIIMLNQMRN